jgi:hypothetical protein
VPFTVVFHPLRILLPPLFLVVRMFLSPLLLTFQGDLVILGVSHKLLAVIIGAALTLALRPTAHALLKAISGGEKRTMTVRTTAGQAQADSSEDHGMNH